MLRHRRVGTSCRRRASLRKLYPSRELRAVVAFADTLGFDRDDRRGPRAFVGDAVAPASAAACGRSAHRTSGSIAGRANSAGTQRTALHTVDTSARCRPFRSRRRESRKVARQRQSMRIIAFPLVDRRLGVASSGPSLFPPSVASDVIVAHQACVGRLSSAWYAADHPVLDWPVRSQLES